ncbi:hypothetical protein FACS1894163_09800 [Spirochaetia bacterium]|nr:hypothetical protein FACS1894163_09800 [Spirochaetia bacterium]
MQKIREDKGNAKLKQKYAGKSECGVFWSGLVLKKLRIQNKHTETLKPGVIRNAHILLRVHTVAAGGAVPAAAQEYKLLDNLFFGETLVFFDFE